MVKGRIVRVNDGNDSNNERELVEQTAQRYKDYFFNTSIPDRLGEFSGPVVLTVNPGKMTDVRFHRLIEIPKNLMFVRVRTNAWNMGVVDKAVEFYTSRHVPVALTFMAYYTTPVNETWKHSYQWRKRTLNLYWAISRVAWRKIMRRFCNNPLVYSCGKLEGEHGDTHCARCGNCVREYHNAKERLRE
jgi:hypothetical protein